MFKNIVLCETGGYNEKYVKDISKYRDILNNYTYPLELVGGEFQVKPYLDFDLEIEENDDFDEEMKIMDYQQSLQLVFNLTSQKDIYYTHRKYTKDNKTKYSYHFVIDKIRISWYNLKILITNAGLDTRYPSGELDMSVYSTKRGMYPIYSHRKRPKEGEKEKEFPPFLPMNENDDITKYLISYIEEDFEDYDLKFPKIQKPEVKCLKLRDFDYIFSKALNLNKNKTTDEDLVLTKKLVLECLSYNRAENYEDWIKLGWCLRNIDYRLLDTWIEFSKVGSAFVDGECETLWNKMKEGTLTIGTLKYWCQIDNKIKYDELITNTISPFIDKAIRSDGTHCDVANVVYEYYKNKLSYDTKLKSWFKVDEKSNIWFRDDDKGTRVRLILGTSICNLFIQRTQYWNNLQMNIEDEEQKTANSEKAKKSLKIATQLKNAGFRDNVMKEMKSVFATDDFFEKYIDKKYHLFAFKNCLYDTEMKQIRDIEPTDYIMTTTDYDFDMKNVNMEFVKKIEDTLHQIQPDENLYQYLIDVTSLRLFGKNLLQQFYIFTGGGANGKSVWLNLCEQAFGKYFGKLNPETFTEQSRGSNQTSELSGVISSRIVGIEEPDDNKKLIVNTIKELSGDAPRKTRGLYQEAFTFTPQFALIFLCNDIPALSKVEYAVARRLRVLNFPTKFVDNPVLLNERLKDILLNKHITDNSIKYGQAFMYILINNWNNKNLIEKLETPDEVFVRSNEYMAESNEVKSFLEENYEKVADDTAKISASVLYANFRMLNRETKMRKDTFKKLVEEEGFRWKKESKGNFHYNIKVKVFQEDE